MKPHLSMQHSWTLFTCWLVMLWQSSSLSWVKAIVANVFAWKLTTVVSTENWTFKGPSFSISELIKCTILSLFFTMNVNISFSCFIGILKDWKKLYLACFESSISIALSLDDLDTGLVISWKGRRSFVSAFKNIGTVETFGWIWAIMDVTKVS